MSSHLPAANDELNAQSLDKSGRRVRAMFSQIANRYDVLNHLLSFNQDTRWRRRAIRHLSPRRGETVLDLCCGTGDLALECRRQQPRCHIVGADFALPMLHLARTKVQANKVQTHKTQTNKANRTNSRHMSTRASTHAAARGAQDENPIALPFLAGDALCLPFRDASFDAIMVAFGARNFQNTSEGLREMRRVLKPGGRVLVLEFMRPTSPLIQRGFGLFFKRVLPRIGKLVSRHDSAYNYLPASVDGFYTRREFETLLRKCGFSRVRSSDFTLGVATCFVARRK